MDFQKRMREREKQKLEEQKAEDSGDDTSGSEDYEIKFLFKSALDVGSTFLKILPDEEDMTFYHTRDGYCQAKCYIENITPKSSIAFLGWTSHPGEFTIDPPYGFVRPGEFRYITFTFKSDKIDTVEEGLYFIKGLPLSHTLDVDELEDNIEEVFHLNNQRILFTLATLSADYNLEERAEDVKYDHHVDRDNIIYSQQYQKKVEKEKKLQENDRASVKISNKQNIPAQPRPDDNMPDSGETSNNRESDLLGLNDPSHSSK